MVDSHSRWKNSTIQLFLLMVKESWSQLNENQETFPGGKTDQLSFVKVLVLSYHKNLPKDIYSLVLKK